MYLLSMYKVFDVGYSYDADVDNSISTLTLQIIIISGGISAVLLMTHNLKFRKKISV